MLEVKLEDLHIAALNRSIQNIEIRLRKNKNMDWTEMSDDQRKRWKEQLRQKQKKFRRLLKKTNRLEEYEAYLEREAERHREDQILQLND